MLRPGRYARDQAAAMRRTGWPTSPEYPLDLCPRGAYGRVTEPHRVSKVWGLQELREAEAALSEVAFAALAPAESQPRVQMLDLMSTDAMSGP